MIEKIPLHLKYDKVALLNENGLGIVNFYFINNNQSIGHFRYYGERFAGLNNNKKTGYVLIPSDYFKTRMSNAIINNLAYDPSDLLILILIGMNFKQVDEDAKKQHTIEAVKYNKCVDIHNKVSYVLSLYFEIKQDQIDAMFNYYTGFQGGKFLNNKQYQSKKVSINNLHSGPTVREIFIHIIYNIIFQFLVVGKVSYLKYDKQIDVDNISIDQLREICNKVKKNIDEHQDIWAHFANSYFLQYQLKHNIIREIDKTEKYDIKVLINITNKIRKIINKVCRKRLSPFNEHESFMCCMM